MAIGRIRLILIPAFLALLLLILLEKNFLPGLSRKNSTDDQFKLVGSVAYLIRDEYVEEPNPSKTMDGAFRGLVDSLDPLSSYLDKNAVLKYEQRRDPNLKEPGITFYKTYGSFPVIIRIKENSPAEKAGLKLGESVSIINGRSTLPMSMVELNLLLKDKSTDPVMLKVLRGSGSDIVSLEREPIPAETFSYTASKGTSGILKILRLYPPCVTKMKEELLPTLKTKKKPLILDLRDCTEGDIEEAQKFLDIFVSDTDSGYFENGQGIRETLALQTAAELAELPLVIWTNQATIGPAEAIGAVLKTHKKVRVIGFQTPGLVSKQRFISLEDGSGLLLTSAVFHLNGDKDFWEKGIAPDIEIDSENITSGAYLEATQKLLAN
ncbi:MAG: S41 family peptidase [Candidatus Aminicenantes bacterium]|jgi:C-terminal peptidase prc